MDLSVHSLWSYMITKIVEFAFTNKWKLLTFFERVKLFTFSLLRGGDYVRKIIIAFYNQVMNLSSLCNSLLSFYIHCLYFSGRNMLLKNLLSPAKFTVFLNKIDLTHRVDSRTIRNIIKLRKIHTNASLKLKAYILTSSVMKYFVQLNWSIRSKYIRITFETGAKIFIRRSKMKSSLHRKSLKFN